MTGILAFLQGYFGRIRKKQKGPACGFALQAGTSTAITTSALLGWGGRVVKKIRRDCRADVPILFRLDSAYLDHKLLAEFERLRVGYGIQQIDIFILVLIDGKEPIRHLLADIPDLNS